MGKYGGMNVEFSGLDKLLKSFDASKTRARKDTFKAVERTVKQAQANSKAVAAVDTGFMKAHINTRPTENHGDVITGWYESETPYGGYVEYGTRKMAAQPYMRPGTKQAEQFFYQELRRLLSV